MKFKNTYFSAQIKKILIVFGESCTEFSKRTGLSASLISKIINRGQNAMKYENMEKLAKSLGVSREWLIGGAYGSETASVEKIIDSTYDNLIHVRKYLKEIKPEETDNV